MKNKLRYIVLILLLSILCINNVYAEEFVVSATASSTEIAKGNEASILINLKASEAIKECLFKFESDSNLEYVSITSANGWSVSENGVEGVNLSNGSWSAEVSPEGQNIAELKYKVNGNGSVVVKTVQCVSTVDENSYKHQDLTVNFTTKDIADDTTLSSMTVTNGTMSPSNISAGYTGDYIISLKSSTFGLAMKASNPDYQDKIVVTDVDGKVISDVSNITFDGGNRGQMPLTITVNGKTSYSLLVTYVEEGLDNTLSSLTINGKELIKDGETDYKYTVGKDVTEFVVAATLKDSENFTFGASSNAPDTFTIKDVVYVLIEVVPKDSSSGAKGVTYTVEVTREGSEASGGNGSSKEPGNNTGNVNKNPTTSDVPMFLMAFILIASLVGSIVLYRKNLESYK